MNTLTFDEQVALLIKDLSGRLPHKVIINYPRTSYLVGEPNTREAAVLTGIDPLRREYSIGSKYTRISGLHIIFRGKIIIKPYLRPMSSMTEEEIKEYKKTCEYSENDEFFYPTFKTYDWLNAHHFDYRGLIPLGLAIDVTTLEDNPYNDEFIY